MQMTPHTPDSWSLMSARGLPQGRLSNSRIEQIQTTNANDTTYPRQLEPQVSAQVCQRPAPKANDTTYPQQLEPQLVGIARSISFFFVESQGLWGEWGVWWGPACSEDAKCTFPLLVVSLKRRHRQNLEEGEGGFSKGDWVVEPRL